MSFGVNNQSEFQANPISSNRSQFDIYFTRESHFIDDTPERNAWEFVRNYLFIHSIIIGKGKGHTYLFINEND